MLERVEILHHRSDRQVHLIDLATKSIYFDTEPLNRVESLSTVSVIGRGRWRSTRL
jgi:hypothetical protein